MKRAHVMNAKLYMHCVDTCAKNNVKQTHFLRVETCSKIYFSCCIRNAQRMLYCETMSACDVRRRLKTIGRISAGKSANVRTSSNLLLQLDCAKVSY